MPASRAETPPEAAVAEVAAADREREPEPIPELVSKGIEEFNRGEFFECHEYLEDAWREESRQVRFLYQGILQVGVGFYHLKNGNWRGATGLLRNGIERLRDFEPETLSIDVSRLVDESQSCLEHLETLGREKVNKFDLSRIPRVHWVDP
jgi:predicted metal-dependent hydrolase